MPKQGNLFFLESGAGYAERTPLVWLHGAGGAGEQWPHQLRRLPGRRVLTPDLPGHGRSGGLAPSSIEGYAESVALWLEGMGISKAVLGGHSLGAAIALKIALSEPELVEKLIVFGAGARMPVNPQLLRQLGVPAFADEAVQQIARWCFSAQAKPHLRQAMLRQLQSNQAEALYADFQACATFVLGDGLGNIWQPCLVVATSEDVMVPPYLGRELSAGLRRGNLRILEGAGHMMMQELSGVCALLVLDFLSAAG